ncbi:MAG: ComEC/Rec2 family competence protein [Candidatus Cryptobacteroides sp.]
MTEERDFAGFAIPFTSAVAVATFSFATIPSAAFAGAGLSFVAAGLSVLPLAWLAACRIIPVRRAVMSVVLAGFLCGLVCGFSARELSVSYATGPLSISAENFGERMKGAIDRMEFSSSGTNALVKALLTGDKTGLAKDVTSIFRESGASHILALSGLHLGIIYGVISKIMSFAGNSPIMVVIRYLMTLAICGFYTMATGAGPSMTRAFLFITIAQTATLLHRKQSLRGIFWPALVIHLTLFPSDISRIGFQLSYAAMAGIAWIYPNIKGIWNLPENEPDNGVALIHKIWDSAALAISCQIAAGIPAWLYFGTFPKYFLLTNLLAAPLTGLLIPSALLCLVTESIFGNCPDILLDITEFLCETMTFILQVISGM